MSKRFAPISAIAATVLILATFFSTAVAQDASGTPEADIALHPAHIHSGTCDDIGDVVFPLNDLQAASSVITPDSTPSATEAEEAVASPAADREVVAQSSSVVEATLDDILADEHVINVHESPNNMGTYIACGEVSGTADEGQLTIDLHELNDSGYAGEAMLTDMGDGTTTVQVTIFPSDIPDGTPEATPET